MIKDQNFVFENIERLAKAEAVRYILSKVRQMVSDTSAELGPTRQDELSITLQTRLLDMSTKNLEDFRSECDN